MKKLMLILVVLAAMWQVCVAEDLPDTVWTKQGLPTVYDIKFLPDSKSMLVATMRGIFHIGIDGNIIDTIYYNQIYTESHDIRRLEIFPDGEKCVFTTYDGQLLIYDLIIRDTIKSYKFIWVYDIAVTNDSKYLIISSTVEVDSKNMYKYCVFETINFNQIHESELSNDNMPFVSVSPKNNYFYIISRGGVFPKDYYDLIKKYEIKTWKDNGIIYIAKNHQIFDMDISPDGKYLAVGLDDSTAKIIDLNANKVIMEFNPIGYMGVIRALCFTSDSKYLVTAVIDNTKIWDLETNELIKTYKFGLQHGLDVSNDSRYIIGSRSPLILLNIPKELRDVFEIIKFDQEIIYPNPVTNKAQLNLNLNNPSTLIIELYDIRGTKLKTIFNNYIADGKHQFEIDMSIYPPGMYFCNIKAGSYFKTIKTLKLR